MASSKALTKMLITTVYHDMQAFKRQNKYSQSLPNGVNKCHHQSFTILELKGN